jgi:hypothetical protein
MDRAHDGPPARAGIFESRRRAFVLRSLIADRLQAAGRTSTAAAPIVGALRGGVRRRRSASTAACCFSAVGRARASTDYFGPIRGIVSVVRSPARRRPGC